MALWNTVMCSTVKVEDRFDGEYYSPFYLDMDNTLSRITNVDALGRLVFSIRKGIFDISPNRYRDKGVPLVRTLQIKSPLLSKESLIYIDAEDHVKNFSKTELVPGDIVFTKIGAGIGDVAVLPLDFERYNFSQNVAGASVNREKIDGFYLLAYLATKWGRKQLHRYMMPSGQGKLELRDIKKIRVVRLGDAEAAIGGLIVEAENLARLSIENYALAQQLLESELGLDKLMFQKPVGYTARFSEIEVSRRADADFFNPELKYLQGELKNRLPLKPLPEYGDVLKFSNPPYGTEGIPIITQKHLSNIAPADYGDDLVAPISWTIRNPAAVLRKNDLLYYSVGAYLGKTNQWLSDEKAVHASFITLLRCHTEADAGYLQVLLNSRYGILQSKCFQSGTSQPYIYPKDIRRFLVPDIPQAMRVKTHNLVLESHKNSKESERLIKQAKARVEQLIEEAIQP